MSTLTRKIVKIDEDKCNGCGLCVPDCAEGAIQIIDGKARLVAENLCDGLGNCLGACPQDAIIIEERPAESFDEQAVETRLQQLKRRANAEATPCDVPGPSGCPGAMMQKLSAAPQAGAQAPVGASAARQSQLGAWPIQLALLPPTAPLWQDADVLIAADCVAFAMPDFHERLLKGKSLAIACPKLDDAESYIAKLTAVFSANNVKSITVARMEVPCCGGLVHIVRTALERANATIALNEVIVSVGGKILSINGLAVA